MTGLALALLTLGLVWLFYKVTTYALPCLIGLAATRYALETGAGWIGACVVFGLTAALAFALMRWLFSAFTQPAARIVVALAFITPAVVMSYLILDEVGEGHIPSELWRQSLCGLGAGLIGLMAFVRLAEGDGQRDS